MLIENFIYSVIANNDLNTLYKVKNKMLIGNEPVYIDFIKDFYTQYSKLPDQVTFENKFNLNLIQNQESAQYWFKEIDNKYKEKVTEDAIKDSARNKKKAPEIFQNALIAINTEHDVEVHSYSDGKRRAQEYSKRKGTKGVTYLSTGSPDLDAFSSGYKKADLWTIGGPEGLGKTWKLLRMACWLDLWQITNKIDRPIVVISGEMPAEELEERLDAIRCGISYERLAKGELNPKEERAYLRFMTGFKSNIKIIDTFDNINDIDHFAVVFQPSAMFIDGSHLLSSSYEWTDIAKVTKNMKNMTRNRKIPIVNTTHLKADKGRSANGGSMDDFAYTKGYTRDSDIVGVMYASDMMVINRQFGLDWVKVRRGNRMQMVFQNDYETCKTELVTSLTGQQLNLGQNKKANRPTSDGNARGGGQVSEMYDTQQQQQTT